MWVRKLFYLVVFIFCTWLAIATRTHRAWFHPLAAAYGGDVIWAGMFLFLLRIFFMTIQLYKLALICYGFGVADELLQLYHAPWIESIRQTRIGGLVLGFGFLWSDMLCYAIGTLIAYALISFIERNDKKKHEPPAGF